MSWAQIRVWGNLLLNLISTYGTMKMSRFWLNNFCLLKGSNKSNLAVFYINDTNNFFFVDSMKITKLWLGWSNQIQFRGFMSRIGYQPKLDVVCSNSLHTSHLFYHLSIFIKKILCLEKRVLRLFFRFSIDFWKKLIS